MCVCNSGIIGRSVKKRELDWVEISRGGSFLSDPRSCSRSRRNHSEGVFRGFIFGVLMRCGEGGRRCANSPNEFGCGL